VRYGLCFQIFEQVYLASLEECKNHLHEHILLTKGDNHLHI